MDKPIYRIDLIENSYMDYNFCDTIWKAIPDDIIDTECEIILCETYLRTMNLKWKEWINSHTEHPNIKFILMNEFTYMRMKQIREL